MEMIRLMRLRRLELSFDVYDIANKSMLSYSSISKAKQKASWDKTPMTKCHCPKPQYKKCTPQPQNPNPQTHKSVAFHTLTFSPWHSDWIP